MDEDVFYAGAVEQGRLVRDGEVSAHELVDALLARIDRLDRTLHAFTVVMADQARADADARDAARARHDELPPLHGIPVAVKEELDVAGQVTTFGGRGNSTPVAEAGEVVRRLRAAGAIVVGKTAMPEFGQWPFSESTAHGLTRNPWDATRSPGGSSGGSAVAVAAGMVPVAIGGDGGGSIRIPAACCGLFGSKPQRGRVTTAPSGHLWWALGIAGPLTRTVRTARWCTRRSPARHRTTGSAPRPRTHRSWRRSISRRGHYGSAGPPGRSPSASDPTRSTCPPSGRPPSCWLPSGTGCGRWTPATPTRRPRSSRSSSAVSRPRQTRWSTPSCSSGAPARHSGWARGSGRLWWRGGSDRARRLPRRPTESSRSPICC